MKQRKFGQAALDAIDASLTEAETMWGDSPGMEQTCRELRAIRRVIVACGRVTDIESKYISGEYDPTANWKIVEVCEGILKARAVEQRRRV